MGVEPIAKTPKAPYLRCFLNFIAVFVAILIEEANKGCSMICDIPFGNVCVDPSHSLIVRPSTYLHCHFFRHAQVVRQGGKAVAQPVQSHLRQAIAFTYAVDVQHNRIRSHIHNKLPFPTRRLKRCPEWRYNRDGSPGGFVFCLVFAHQLAVRPIHRRPGNMYHSVAQINIAPTECHKLGPAQTG